MADILSDVYEPRFLDCSYGFRPKRSTHDAIKVINDTVMHKKINYILDCDIKGFFDNISHTKLIRQIWALGIRDKKLLCIIKEMLKAPVVLPDGKKTYPARGTPQGGILSPLLANIVLNELDWWIASQWRRCQQKQNSKRGAMRREQRLRATLTGLCAGAD